MNNKKNIVYIILIAIFIIFCISFFILHKNVGMKNKQIVVLNENNIEEYEAIFNKELEQYVNKEDKNMKVKDITDSELNNAYRNNELVMQDCFAQLGMLPVHKMEDMDFGISYRIPSLYLDGNSNLLLSNENDEEWIVTEKAVRITYNFDALVKGDGAVPNIQIGIKGNGNFLTTSNLNNKNGHFEGSIWMFEGDCFYPWLQNLGANKTVIVNGEITILRDDAIQKHSENTGK